MPATAQLTAAQAQDARQKYILAFNATMLQIWQERITLLEVIDTGLLLRSPLALPVKADGRFFEVTLSQVFFEYGLWQDYGVGRETPRGMKANSSVWSGASTHAIAEERPSGSFRTPYGDIGRRKVRKRRPWFSKKYYASVLNLRDFLGENIGQEFQGIIADTFARTNKIY